MKSHKLFSSVIISLLAILAHSFPLHAQTNTYSGPANGVWNDPDNWSESVIPNSSQEVLIGSANNSPSLVNQNFTIQAVRFTGSGSRTISIDAGSTLSLGGLTAGEDTFLIRKLTSSTRNIQGAGSLELLSSGQMFFQDNGGAMNINNPISESGGSHQITVKGDGTLTFFANSATSTYSGGLNLHSGTFITNVSSAGAANAPTAGPLGTGTLSFAGGTFVFSGTANGVFHNAIVASDDIHIGNEGASRRQIVFHGNVDLGGDARVFNLNQIPTDSDANPVSFAGVISNGGLVKQGESPMIITGINTFEGDTVIEGGELRINSSGSIASSERVILHEDTLLTITNDYELSSGQVLTGAGQVSTRLRIGQGLIEPGMNGVGTLSFDGELLRLDGGAINFDGDSTGLDQILLSSSGTMDLIGNNSGAVTLNFFDLGDFAGGDFLLIDASSLDDPTISNWGLDAFTLGNLPSGWSANFYMDGNSLGALIVVPEPSSYASLAALIALGASWVWRRQRPRS